MLKYQKTIALRLVDHPEKQATATTLHIILPSENKDVKLQAELKTAHKELLQTNCPYTVEEFANILTNQHATWDIIISDEPATETAERCTYHKHHNNTAEFNRYKNLENDPFVGIRQTDFKAEISCSINLDCYFNGMDSTIIRNVTRGKIYTIYQVRAYGSFSDWYFIDDVGEERHLSDFFFVAPNLDESED